MRDDAFELLELSYYELQPSEGLAAWLDSQRLGLAFTTGEDLFALGVAPDGRLSVESTEFDRCTALAAPDSETLLLAGRYQVWLLANAAPPGRLAGERFDRLYMPQSAHTVGALGVLGLAAEAGGRVLFCNTAFSCLAAADERKNFRALWLPPWVPQIALGDACHLSGLALRDGAAAYVTCFSRGAEPDSWRSAPPGSGVVVDLRSGEVVCGGLTAPYAPRWHQGRLWVVCGGTGELGVVDEASGRFEPVARCPGFARGLALHGDFAVVAASRRRGPGGGGSEISVVDLRSGEVAERLGLRGTRVQEVFDVVALPGVRRPAVMPAAGEAIQQTVTVGPGAR